MKVYQRRKICQYIKENDPTLLILVTEPISTQEVHVFKNFNSQTLIGHTNP
jgi:hypothetical protein